MFARWYVVPADRKWFTDTVVADVIVETLKALKMSYPIVNGKHRQEIQESRKRLERESSSARAVEALKKEDLL